MPEEMKMPEGTRTPETEKNANLIIEQDKRKTKPYSKRIIFFGLLLIGGLILVLSMQTHNVIESNAPTTETRNYDTSKRSFLDLAAEVQASAQRPAPLPPQEIIREVLVHQPAETVQVVTPLPRQRKYYSNQADRQMAEQLRMMNIQAIMTPPKADGFEDNKTAAASGGGQQGLLPQTASVSGGLDSSQLLAALTQQQGTDPNRQQQKADFLRNEAASLTSQGYSENLPIPQQFYLELKAGTVIPGMLVTGVNSDLPGPVIGQVSENVWDSTHGRHVLIPKGTRILGVYNSDVTFGQTRVQVVWNRLIFPNGTSLNIAGSPGLDQSGYSGMRGRVNEHWGRMITTALFASAFVTGAEIISPSQNQSGYGNQAKSPGEIASEQVANAILDMSSRLMNKNMDIQPTITIRPGRRFNIFVEKDIVFPEPYPIGL